ncbi:MAG: MFS transporter [Puniceicoccaceae bacterium]|nr:MAG: MFS transporter [Puniceicoccaceae bacterium]
MTEAKPAVPTPAQENIWVSLGCNIIVPSLILIQGSKFMAKEAALLVALAFPVVYFFYDLSKRKKYNFISILGFVSILLTGGIGLLALPRVWMIVKETAIPLIIGLAVLLSLKTRWPLVRTLLYNDRVIHVGKVDEGLEAQGTRADFERLLATTNRLLAAAFFLSAVLNFLLASWIFQSEPPTADEIGRMTAWSFPVIMVPCMAVMMVAIFRLMNGLPKLTGLELEEIFVGAKKEE